jgi:hypothetical protein
MTIKITRQGNQIKATGRPTLSNVGLTFAILFIIGGIIAFVAHPGIGSAIIFFIAWLIAYASNRHAKHERQKALVVAEFR